MLKRTALLLTLLMFSTSLFGQSVDEIIKKNIEAKGGYDKIKSVQSRKAVGKIVIPMQGLELGFTMYNKRPNKLRIESEFQGNKIVQAFDGETAWMIMPMMGDPNPQKMPDAQAKEIVEQADFDGDLVDYKDKGITIELVGKEDMEGTPVYKLKVTKKNGDVNYYYLDAEYFLELKVETTRKIQGQEIHSESFLSDYKEVDGLMIPFSIEAKMNGQVAQQIVLEKIEHNVELSDTLFTMPRTEEKK